MILLQTRVDSLLDSQPVSSSLLYLNYYKIINNKDYYLPQTTFWLALRTYVPN